LDSTISIYRPGFAFEVKTYKLSIELFGFSRYITNHAQKPKPKINKAQASVQKVIDADIEWQPNQALHVLQRLPATHS